MNNEIEIQNKIQLFENSKIRSLWDSENEKWYFSVVDVIAVLTESPNPRKYWSVLKTRLKSEGSQLATNCSQLKMLASDGKMYKTDCMTTEQLLRLVQSIPSPKAEPFKLWLAKIGSDFLKDAYLTDLMYKTWASMSAKEYKELKGLKKENLRDNMTNIELILNMLAEASATELSQNKNPSNLTESANIAVAGAEVAKDARISLEKRGGKTITSKNAKELGIKELPFENEIDTEETF